MPVRSNRLPKNSIAGCLDDIPLRTVHQRPPKNIAPSETPATSANTRTKASYIVVLLFVSHLLVFLAHPMPGIQTADDQTDYQQRQRPGNLSRMTIVQPDTERGSEQRRDHHRPADQTHHAQAEPDPLRGVAPRLQLTRCLRGDLPAERIAIIRALDFRFFTHGETPPGG